MLGPIGIHAGLHFVEQLLFVLGQLHINEVHYNNAAEVTQSQLSGDLFGRLEIGLKGILFLIAAYTFVSAVHINHVQGFGMLDNNVSAAIEVDRFAERRFYLFGNAKSIEHR